MEKIIVKIQNSTIKLPLYFIKNRDRDRIRTCDRLLRRQMLYPAELLDLKPIEKCNN